MMTRFVSVVTCGSVVHARNTSDNMKPARISRSSLTSARTVDSNSSCMSLAVNQRLRLVGRRSSFQPPASNFLLTTSQVTARRT